MGNAAIKVNINGPWWIIWLIIKEEVRPWAAFWFLQEAQRDFFYCFVIYGQLKQTISIDQIMAKVVNLEAGATTSKVQQML